MIYEYYIEGRFNEGYEPTIENTIRKSVLSPECRLNLEIVDTAGISEYCSNLSRNSTIGVHGYLLVFSTVSRSSLEKLKSVNSLLLTTLGDPPQNEIPRVLVGTMCDLTEQRCYSRSC